jgi:hypothetical protein
MGLKRLATYRGYVYLNLLHKVQNRYPRECELLVSVFIGIYPKRGLVVGKPGLICASKATTGRSSENATSKAALLCSKVSLQ